jgi:hypothetical protein
LVTNKLLHKNRNFTIVCKKAKRRRSVIFQRRNNIEIETRFDSLDLPPFHTREKLLRADVSLKKKSAITIWREFRTKFENDPQTGHSITNCHEKSEHTGCFCRGNTSGLLSTNEKTNDRNWQAYL